MSKRVSDKAATPRPSPPHFHATYGEFEIMVGITDGLVTGRFPRRALVHVLEWWELHMAGALGKLGTSARARSARADSPIGVATKRREERRVLQVVDVRVLQDFRIWLRFNNGTEGVANLAPSLHGAMFAPLRDPSLFALARLDPELHTVAWSNGR